ncbi:MAG TPA: hypothetical protein VJK05_00545, partial [archaeon]|nr:hypothetical protein [archaeon]
MPELGEQFKGFYKSLEDKYYGALDSLNKSVPVYKAIDPIDKIVPSFAVLLVLLLLLIGFFFFSALEGIGLPAQQAVVIVSAFDELNNPVEGAFVSFEIKGETLSAETNKDGEAEFRVPINSSASLSIEKKGFISAFKDVPLIEGSRVEAVELEKEKPKELSKIISIVNSRGQPVSNALVSFSCSNEFAVPPLSEATNNLGKVQTVVSNDCGRLTASLKASGFRNLDSYALLSDNETILFQEDPSQLGTIKVNVSSQGQNADNVLVKVYRFFEQNLGPVHQTFSSNGLAEFTGAFPGDYLIKTEANSDFGEASSDLIVVSAGSTANVNLNVQRNVIGSIKVKAVEKGTRRIISNAKVKLLAGSEELASKTTDNEGRASFEVSRDLDYTIIIDQENYLVQAQNLRLSAEEKSIELEKFIGSNGGTLKVNVKDSDGRAVQNAKVVLFNEDEKRLAVYSEQATDLNGTASFTRVQQGNFSAIAYKGSAQGKSIARSFDPRLARIAEINLVMDIPLGTVSVKVLDEEKTAVPFARVRLHDQSNNSIAADQLTDDQGLIEFSVPADKKVFISVEKDNSRFFSTVKAVNPNSVTAFEAVLEKRLALGPVKVEFLGMYASTAISTEIGDSLEGIVSTLATGQRYKARFKVKIPENNEYREAGLHVRTGSFEIMEKDQVIIKSVNAPGAVVVKGTSFNEKLGYEEDSKNISFGDSKWFNAVWRGVLPGVYEVEAELEVKTTASLDDQLELNYKAWGIDKGKRDRDPEDVTPAANPLYDSTKREIYQVGISTICSEDFCFDATVFDIQEKILHQALNGFEGKVFNEYNLKFNLLNNNELKVYNNAFIRIRNNEQNLLMKRFTLSNSETGETKGTANAFRLNDYSVGNFTPKKRVSADIDFRTEKAGSGSFSIQLISDNRIVFEKIISINSQAINNLKVEVQPSTLSSGIENKLILKVRDEQTNLEIEKAVLTVKDRFGIILDSTTSSRLGDAELNLSAQNPGENLTLTATKPNYNEKVIAVKVSEEILELTPQQLSVSINAKTKPESEEVIILKNLTNFPFKIDSVELTGNFKGILNEQEMNNYAKQFEGLELLQGESKEFKVRTILTEEGKLLTERENLQGTLTLRATNFGQIWTFKVPMNIAVGIGAEVDSPDCLTLTKTNYETSSEGSPIRTEFELVNNCTVQGIPIQLQDARVKLDLQSNKLGEYLLEFKEDNIVKAKFNAAPAYFKRALSAMNPTKRYSVTLVYTPSGGVIGEQKADLIFTALNPTEAGQEQELQAKLSTKFSIVNIADCLVFDKELIIIDKGKEGEFSIETKECGGATKFFIDSPLDTSLSEVTLESNQKSPPILVFAGENFQGQYPINIKVEPEHAKTAREIKLIRARVLDPESCIKLNRYEFDIYEDPLNPDYSGYDDAILTNKCFDKPITVEVNDKDWGKALQTGALWAIPGFVVGLGGWVNQMVEQGEFSFLPLSEEEIAINKEIDKLSPEGKLTALEKLNKKEEEKLTEKDKQKIEALRESLADESDETLEKLGKNKLIGAGVELLEEENVTVVTHTLPGVTVPEEAAPAAGTPAAGTPAPAPPAATPAGTAAPTNSAAGK